ncbi:MAG: permease [Nanobdellota archaeon]
MECCNTPKRITIGRNLKITSIIFLAFFAASLFLPTLYESLMVYLGKIWWAILLGLLIGGLIDTFVPRSFIYKHLSGSNSIFKAVIAGFLLSACSHGILALAIQLHKKGASIPSVITFLLASPWANLPVTIMLFGFFGWHAILFVLAAMVIAVITGYIFVLLEKKGLIESSPEKGDDTKADKPKPSFRAVMRGSVSLANMVLWWILIGIMASALVGAYVPQEFFINYLGPGIGGILITLAFATIIEVCSEGSAPIAFEIFRNTAKLGNPFVFLMAGVATDYTEIGLIWTNIGKKTALWLPAVTVPQIIVVAVMFNSFIP